MYRLFAPILFLPVVELVGFIVIGGEIGLLKSLVWLVAATWLGFYLMRLRGSSALARAQRGAEDEVFVVQDLFDGICLFVASLLLIFPGFISDFIAVPFLVSPLRRYVFERIRSNPNHPARKFAHMRHAAARPGRPPDTIEGEYKSLDK